MATVSHPVPPVNPVKLGFPGLKCLLCGEPDGIRLALEDLDVFQCGSCDGEFSAADVRQHLDQWRAVIGWIETAPVAGG